jgi:hypothetical protein
MTFCYTMKLENTKSTLKIEYEQSSDLNACPNERGLSVVTTLGCPEDDNPLSYDRLDGEWLIWYEVAHRFERKVPTQDRGDIRHNIILELALARRRDGNKPFNEAMMFRVASFVIADYWRKANRKPTILSLNNEVDNGDGDTTELINTVADDRAIDVSAWIDARTWLLGCPIRLVKIAQKRLGGQTLSNYERLYLYRYRKRENQKLFAA